MREDDVRTGLTKVKVRRGIAENQATNTIHRFVADMVMRIQKPGEILELEALGNNRMQLSPSLQAQSAAQT